MLPPVTIIETDNGKFMVLRGSDSITHALLMDGVYQGFVADISEFILKDCDFPVVLLDIGANLGAYTIPMALGTRQPRTIHAFEPQRVVFQALCGNVFLNQLDNVRARQCALGNRDEMIRIPRIDYATCGNIGGYSIDPLVLAADRGDFPADSIIGEEDELCEMRRIDSLGLPPCHLVKLDVEGHELEVLKGMGETLRASSYPPILFEAWNVDWFAGAKRELLAHLAGLGYQVTQVDVGDFLAQHPANPLRHVKLDRKGGKLALSHV
jgi:FkbM family methyltransferase